MLFSDVVRGMVLFIVTILGFRHQLEIWHVYVASALIGFVSAFFNLHIPQFCRKSFPQSRFPALIR